MGTDDFTYWLSSFGNEYNVLIGQLSSIDPYFITLMELRDELVKLFKRNA